MSGGAKAWREARADGLAQALHECSGETCPTWDEWCSKTPLLIAGTRVDRDTLLGHVGDPFADREWSNEKQPGIIQPEVDE